MVIAKGEAWGEFAETPGDLITAPTDAELASRIGAEVTADRCPTVVLGAGNLSKDLGLQPQLVTRPETGETRLQLPIDLGWVRWDDGEAVPFIAHCRLHQRAWRGEFAVVMNSGWWGSYYLGPRAHLNDGLVDVTTGRLALRERIEARRRARTGTHLPHPALVASRVPRWHTTFVRPTPIWLDDERRGTATKVEVEVQPDAFFAVV